MLQVKSPANYNQIMRIVKIANSVFQDDLETSITDNMFSDVSPDGQDEQGHDVSTHLPGPLGTVLNSFKPSIMMRLRRRRSTIPERSKGEGGRICLQERKMKCAWLPAFGVTGPIWIWLQ